VKVWLLIALVAAAPASAARYDGVYSNVCVEDETLDQDGIELRLDTSGGRPKATLKICEGGCYPEAVRDLSIRGGRISFLASEKLFDQDGKLAQSLVHRFTGVFVSNGLRLESAGLWPAQHLSRTRRAGPASGPSDWPVPLRHCGRAP
jgi:hypothetical protein